MRLPILLAFTLSAMSTLASGANAQRRGSRDNDLDRPIHFGVGGGVTVPTGDFKRAFDDGWNGQGFVSLTLPGLPISLRATMALDHFNFRDPQLSAGGTPSNSGSSQILSGLGSVALNLPIGFLTPYAMVGLGAFNVRNSLTSVTGGASTDDSQTKFGLDGGAGITVRLLGAQAFVEGRIANVYTNQGTINPRSIKYVPVTFGIIF